MNIFVLDDNMKTSCQYYVDKHIVIIKEMNQLLCTTLNILDAKSKNILTKEIRLHRFAPYKTTHINHPLQQWAMESSANFEWIIEMNRNLINEFQFRYEKKYLKANAVLDFCKNNYKLFTFNSNEPTPFKPATGKYNELNENIVNIYKQYYVNEKIINNNRIAIWTKRNVPEWILQHLNQNNVEYCIINKNNKTKIKIVS